MKAERGEFLEREPDWLTSLPPEVREKLLAFARGGHVQLSEKEFAYAARLIEEDTARYAKLAEKTTDRAQKGYYERILATLRKLQTQLEQRALEEHLTEKQKQ